MFQIKRLTVSHEFLTWVRASEVVRPNLFYTHLDLWPNSYYWFNSSIQIRLCDIYFRISLLISSKSSLLHIYAWDFIKIDIFYIFYHFQHEKWAKIPYTILHFSGIDICSCFCDFAKSRHAHLNCSVLFH